MSHWFVYIIRSSDERLYTGITTDIKRRWQEHSQKGGGRGAKFFRGRSPKQLCFIQPAENRSEASKLEASIKKRSKISKLELIRSAQNQLSEYLSKQSIEGQ